MAIKERKQITGTTAQIDDYEGHEGQIVWDKDKKTFVGMSGTAGKNYPLASQAYVDTQFLPLAGGVLTGKISWGGIPIWGDSSSNIYIGLDSNYLLYTGLNLGGGANGVSLTLGAGTHYDKDGASISLWGANDPSTGVQGKFCLRAIKGSKIKEFIGTPDGNLTWDNSPLERIISFSGETFRYGSGLQICYGNVTLNSKESRDISFGLPFAQGNGFIASGSAGLVTTSDWTTTQAKLHNTTDAVNYIRYFAIGRWY